MFVIRRLMANVGDSVFSKLRLSMDVVLVVSLYGCTSRKYEEYEEVVAYE